MSYQIEKLKNIALIKTGKLDSNAAVTDGVYPFFTCDPITLKIDEWAYDTEAVLLAGNNASGNYTAKYYKGKFNAYQRTYIIESANTSLLSVRFLAFAITQQLRLLKAMSTGSTTKFLTIKMLNDLEIPCPEISVQQKIASIIGSYDNLIENNQKQIKLLEETAQRLYKKWFVDLRFPGHENVEIVDGVPRGWTRKTVLDCLETYIGGGWGKEDVTSKNTIAGKVIRGTDINDIKSGIYTGIPLRYHTENDKKKRTLKKNDIVFELSNGNIDNIGRSLLIDELILNNCGENTICASFCKLFRPLDKIHSLLLYLEILDMNSSGRMLPYKKQGSNGINNFAFEDFLLHELLIPSDYKMVAFIDTIMSKIMVARSQLALLQEARDRLLPKLMSGEIEV
jgi:type I restriction enzyme ecoDI specificity protein